MVAVAKGSLTDDKATSNAVTPSRLRRPGSHSFCWNGTGIALWQANRHRNPGHGPIPGRSPDYEWSVTASISLYLANASGRTLAFGPAYLSSSTQPGGKGTTILTGHRDTHFAFLLKLQPTDEILVETSDRRQHRYVVRDVSIVDGRTAIIGSDGMPRLALVTCYPFDAIMPGGPLRFVVIADVKA